MKVRKKPLVFDAVEWDGKNLLEVIKFMRQHASAMSYKWEDYEDLVSRDGLKIVTLAGPLKADVGDIIIKGVNGEHYPIKADIFQKTYDVVEQ